MTVAGPPHDGAGDGAGDPTGDATGRVLELTERELHRVLLDIHDGPVQYMYAALSQLDLLQRAVAADARAESADRAERVRALLEAGLAEMRDGIGAMRPPAFAARGLRELIEGLVLQHEMATDGVVALAVDHPLPDAPLPVRIALYRVAQEALSNARRHAAGREVAVGLAARERGGAPWLRLEVRDAGPGFDPAAVVAPGHLGLAGMRDRVAMLGGVVTVDSRPGAGTTVAAEVPAS